ncbi:MAG TPA: hypothetical protein VM756_03105 [Burkholderiales bacterium]|nr:hypothetical protein [Burkholderiales bacterium]
MDAAKVLDGLVSLANADWIALWMIVDDVETQLCPDDDEETLEITVTLVEGLLARGLLAGDPPVTGDEVCFSAWPNQEPGAVGEYIRREWKRRGGPPGWGDAPWFAERLSVSGHA